MVLAEATRDLGGRVTREAGLPGLSEWIRVRDYRLQQLEKMPNVEIFRESELGVEDALAVGADHIAIATGSTWRRDGFGAANSRGISNLGPLENLFTADDIMAGNLPSGPTIVFDDDHYYMGSVLAERLRESGLPVTLVTPEDAVSAWGKFTQDRWRGQSRLMEMGVDLITGHNISSFDGAAATLQCNLHGHRKTAKGAIPGAGHGAHAYGQPLSGADHQDC